MIIGLTGFKHTGKSTAATYLEHEYGFTRLNFKDGLVAELTQNFPDLLRVVSEEEDLTIEELFTQKPPVIRALMQNYGTEVRRREDPDYWVLQWKMSMINRILAGNRHIVTDDVRFINECDAIRSANGVVVRIVRDDIPTGGDHQSETEQLSLRPDHTIHAVSGSYEKLYTALDEIVKNKLDT